MNYEWISVSERLPEDGSLVVAANFYSLIPDPDAAVCNFYNGRFVLSIDGLEASNYDGGASINMEFNPTHWMLLPKSPNLS